MTSFQYIWLSRIQRAVLPLASTLLTTVSTESNTNRGFSRLSSDDYTIACVCPMGVEIGPLRAMLDEQHYHANIPRQPDRSTNKYEFGRIGEHNVVLTVMPGTGGVAAFEAGQGLLRDFKNLRFGLLVGIAGGVPNYPRNDIRLGDVVVARGTTKHTGLLLFDFDENGRIKFRRALDRPPAVVTSNVEYLRSDHDQGISKIPEYLIEMHRKSGLVSSEFFYQGSENDILFHSFYQHEGEDSCNDCDRSFEIRRKRRPSPTPKIHYGIIASWPCILTDSDERDELRRHSKALCVEMEAGGFADILPCLVIRGICDYADSHKNKLWQGYAAATAAAFTKELLYTISSSEVESIKPARETTLYVDVSY